MSVAQRVRWLVFAVVLSAGASLGPFALSSSAASAGFTNTVRAMTPAPLSALGEATAPDRQDAPPSPPASGASRSSPGFTRVGPPAQPAAATLPGPESGGVAQAEEPASDDLLESLGMHEDDSQSVPGLQEVAMAEFAPMFSSLGLSEAAAGGLAGPILGGTAAAGALAGTVTALTDVRSIELGLPISR